MTSQLLVIVLIVAMVIASLPSTSGNRRDVGICRDRLGYFREEDFKISSCSLCYFYLILDNPVFRLSSELKYKTFHQNPYFLKYNKTSADGANSIFPSYDNQTTLAVVCTTLDEDHCTRWKACCHDAWSCCQQQQEQIIPDDFSDYCPQTFDGWSCWNFSRINTTVNHVCPDFLSTSEESKAYKTCGTDGHWVRKNDTGLEFSDYTRCVEQNDYQIYKTAFILSVVLNSVGIVLIIPAIVLFLYYRQLRKQQRIQIHINLFLSLLVTSVFAMLWDIRVKYDRIIHPDDVTSVLHSQQGLCKTLNVIQRLSRATTFFWMTCEGYFLHRLMVNAFLPPKHFTRYIVFGWGVPVCLFVLYASLRSTIADDNLCWITPPEGAKMALEWTLVFIPTIICILVNLIFLVNILRILLLRMVSHPNEPSNFRKALRATLVLIPLFGIHQFCLIYRPSSSDQTGYDVFEMASSVILNSQGIIISLIFCYFNGEVQSHVKSSWTYLRHQYSYRRDSGGRKLSLTNGSANGSRRTSTSSIQNGGLQLTPLNNVRQSNGETSAAFSEICRNCNNHLESVRQDMSSVTVDAVNDHSSTYAPSENGAVHNNNTTAF